MFRGLVLRNPSNLPGGSEDENGAGPRSLERATWPFLAADPFSKGRGNAIRSSLPFQIESELDFVASRGGGPGGQHVNKVASRVTLRFDVAGSRSLSDEQRQRIRARLANRINREGVLQISSHAHRSQTANREQLQGRFARLIAGALRRRRKRRETRPTRASKERRLKNKRRRAEKKKLRGRVRRADE